MDVIRDFRRGAVRLHVLHHAAACEVTGVWMSEELARHGYRISPGTLYPLLHDLEQTGLLVSHQRIEQGRVLRWYRATRAGRTTLATARTVLAELAAELLDEPVARPAGERAASSHRARSARSSRSSGGASATTSTRSPP